MASLASALLYVLSSIFGLSAPGLIGTNMLPAWLQASLLNLRAKNDVSDTTVDASGKTLAKSEPEVMLLRRLRHVDAKKEPEVAHSLHTAIANIMKASGSRSNEALHHLEAASEAAASGSDSDTLLSARLSLADAYVEEGRPLDSQRELVKASGVLADHFTEHQAKLNRGRGRAQFELGFFDIALGYFEEAAKHALQPEEKVRIACDIAMANTCLERPSKSVQPLLLALEVLHASRKAGPDGDMPLVLYNALLADVHFHLGEALHSTHKTEAAKAHYKKALYLHERSPSANAERMSFIRIDIMNLEGGAEPELRCPELAGIPRPPMFLWRGDKSSVPPKDMKSQAFTTKISSLLAEKKYDLARRHLEQGLGTHARPYRSLDAALASNMLGSLDRTREHFADAARHYREALRAALTCCGASNPEATKAYEGLRDIMKQLSLQDQRVAKAMFSSYFDALEMKPIIAHNPNDVQAETQHTSSKDATIV